MALLAKAGRMLLDRTQLQAASEEMCPRPVLCSAVWKARATPVRQVDLSLLVMQWTVPALMTLLLPELKLVVTHLVKSLV